MINYVKKRDNLYTYKKSFDMVSMVKLLKRDNFWDCKNDVIHFETVKKSKQLS